MSAKQQQVNQWVSLAMKHHQANQLVEAEALYRQALESDKRHADATHYLGLLLSQQNKFAEAIELLRRAIMLAPALPHYYFNLAEVLRRAGDVEAALEPARRTVQLTPNSAEATFNLAVILQAVRRWPEAVEAYGRVTQLDPRHFKSFNNLGNLLMRMGLREQALRAFQEGSAVAPDSPELLANWGLALLMAGQHAMAMEKVLRAEQLKPDDPVVQDALGRCASNRFDLADGVRRLHRAVELKPDDAQTHTSLLFVMLHDPQTTDDELLAEHIKWGRQHAPTVEPAPRYLVEPVSNRRLRVAYLSPDFREHPVSFFIEPLLANHTEAVDIHCYNCAPAAELDRTTQRLRGYGHTWRDVCDLTDSHIAKLIREEDKIDVLIDLAGHTQNQRLGVLARRPAAVQATYLGYQTTTGVEAIQYRLTDALVDPPGQTEAYHTEKLVRLEAFACYRPPEGAPDVAAAPCIERGHLTFGSFTKVEKISVDTLDLWAAALAAVPTAKLLVNATAFDEPTIVERFLSLMSARGIDPQRIETIGRRYLIDYLRFHARVDIALDSLPFNAHTTTCHALWMGVPTITQAGNRYASRMGLAVMTHLGLPELIATDRDGFAAIAARVAADPAWLVEIRQSMRQRMQRSVLMDAKRFTQQFESVLSGLSGQRESGVATS